MSSKRLILILLSMTFLFFLLSCKKIETENKTSSPPTLSQVEVTISPEPNVTPQTTIEPGTGKYAEGIKDENKEIKFYLDAEDQNLLKGLHINPDTSAAIQFFPTTTFNKIHVRLCTWTTTTGHSIEVSLYRWQGSYDATLQSEALLVKNYADYKNNLWLEIDLGQEYEDGEYLLDIVNDSEANHVGIWVSKEDPIMQNFYLNDMIYEEGIVQFAIGYTKTPNKLYGPLSDPGF